MASEAGKGDAQRPGDGFDEGYDRIFAPKPKPYGCNGNPRPVAGSVTHYAQDGWEEVVLPDLYPANGPYTTRVPVMVPVRHKMSIGCGYDKKTTDRRCIGCGEVPKG